MDFSTRSQNCYPISLLDTVTFLINFEQLIFIFPGIPLVHTMLWLLVVLIKKDFKVERCLGSYYLEPEFWILDGPRMAELVINLFFICNVIRVLYSKVRESNNTSEAGLKKSVKAAMMLLPLLGVPNIMQTIPFAPTRDNIMVSLFSLWRMARLNFARYLLFGRTPPLSPICIKDLWLPVFIALRTRR